MDFVETMAEYLTSNGAEEYSPEQGVKLDRIEKRYPGFRERYGRYLINVDGYRSTGDDDLLIELLHEGFLIDGVFEEDQVICMQAFWARAAETRKKFLKDDQLIEGTEC